MGWIIAMCVVWILAGGLCKAAASGKELDEYMSFVEYQRREECKAIDCPVLPDCTVCWGRDCIKQHGNKIPRLRPGAYRRARGRLRVPVSSERIGKIGTVFYLRHPMQETFERAVDDE